MTFAVLFLYGGLFKNFKMLFSLIAQPLREVESLDH